MIIESLLDTDLYKVSMGQVVLHKFSSAHVKLAFKCRTEDMGLIGLKDKIQEEIDHLCTLRFTKEELNYLGTIRFLSKDYIDFLSLLQLNKDFIKIEVMRDRLEIIIEGPWFIVIYFEIPVLAIINELYNRELFDLEIRYEEGKKRLLEKIKVAKDYYGTFKFSEFGTRRRFTKYWQEEVIQTLKEELPDKFTGTSNVMLAMKHNLTPVGTMAHEFLQACQALGPRLIDSQKFALQTWAEEYRGDLGIALSDVVGMDAFLRDFDLYFCKLFDGARHDSGDPYIWCEKLINHYERNKIDPKTKMAVFSDCLTMEKAVNIARTFDGRIKTSFGIGTHLVNDMGVIPLQMVIKMIECEGQPVAKISDSPGKEMCRDENYIKYVKEVFRIR